MWMIVALVSLAVSATWMWRLATQWDTPPSSGQGAKFPIPIGPRLWHFAILAGIVSGVAVALFSVLVLR